MRACLILPFPTDSHSVVRRRLTALPAAPAAFINPLEWAPQFDEPDDPSDLEDPLGPANDDEHWDVFLPDDPYEPRPEPDDFWIDADDE